MKIRIRLKSCNGGYVLDNWSVTYNVNSIEWRMAVKFLCEYEKRLKRRQSNFVLDQHVSVEQSYAAKLTPIVSQNKESCMDMALRLYYS